LEPLAAGLDLKLHFTARQRGFLYIVAPDEKDALRAFLTAQPTRSSGVVSNELIADVDYVFPAGDDNWIGLTAGAHDQIHDCFLADAANKPEFSGRPGKRAVNSSRAAGVGGVSETAQSRVPGGDSGVPRCQSHRSLGNHRWAGRRLRHHDQKVRLNSFGETLAGLILRTTVPDASVAL
jgi:hypothetical protein